MVVVTGGGGDGYGGGDGLAAGAAPHSLMEGRVGWC